ncbi:hypothetical protein AXG93_1671s1020 [Marchantia polymorpha subsp. ruderalis]|uniref:Uncharacterized protein n=1 Tax=Marchantia polymorpha subsp. ruderalis TaxID=1480154 RepID=A0A176WMV9_MARPO|nr:hypothetical protein AXG93_1671s1020 [Marchantia polymorpha subsp. ruderalis]
MNFLLWGWNWASKVIVQEWDNNGLPKPPGYWKNPETWQIWDRKKVLGRCAGDDGDLTFDNENVRVTREEERAYATLFKHSCTGKNGYRIIWYHDRLRQNVAMALMQIFCPAQITYMMTWQVEFVKRAMRVDCIHRTCIFWTATRQHIKLIQGGSACYLSPFFINFYRDPSRATRKDKGKAVLMEEVSPRQDEVPSAGIKMKTPLKRTAEVLAVSSHTEEDLAALEEVAVMAVEDVGRAACGSQKVASPGHPPGQSYWRRVLQKRLAKEVEKRVYSEKACEGLLEDVEKAKCVTVNLLSNLEACQIAYNTGSLRVDELTAASEKKEQEYEIELTAKAKKLAESAAARISDLELI